MSKYRALFFFVILLTAAMGAVRTSAQGPTVAILVVDVFEVISEPAPIPDQGINCVFTIDGQDSYRWQGFADGLTPLLHPVETTHGQQVHGIIQGLLDNEFGAGTPFTSTAPSLSEDWLRDMMTWQDNQIYLVGIDTNAYTSALMVERIRNTIEALYGAEGVTNFVVNMSFAIIPCSDIPRDGFRHYTDGFKVEGNEELTSTCEETARDLIAEDRTLQENQRFTQLADESNCEDLANLADDPELEEEDQERATQAAELLLEVLSQPAFQEVRVLVYFSFLRPQIPAIFQTAYYAVNAPHLTNDPFTTFLENDGLRQYCESLDQNLNCIAVAAAGNDGRNFPYAPASLPSVISTTAEFSSMPTCSTAELEALENQLTELANENTSDTLPADVPDIIFDLTNPRSNDGEVQMDGVLDIPISLVAPCLRFWGTSFAAPRLSYEMAIHLFNGGTAGQCSGQAAIGVTLTTFTSEPPLNYADGASGNWENLPFSDAKAKYCDSF